jgi:hypothetical protein
MMIELMTGSVPNIMAGFPVAISLSGTDMVKKFLKRLIALMDGMEESKVLCKTLPLLPGALLTSLREKKKSKERVPFY